MAQMLQQEDTTVSTLQDLRKAAGLKTRRQAADLLGVAENTVYRWETERTPVPTYVAKCFELLIENRNLEQLVRESSGALVDITPVDLNAALRRAFRIAREVQHLTQEQLAERSHTSRSWVVHFEQHNSLPSRELFAEALAALDIDERDIINRIPRLGRTLAGLNSDSFRTLFAMLVLSGAIMGVNPIPKAKGRDPRSKGVQLQLVPAEAP